MGLVVLCVPVAGCGPRDFTLMPVPAAYSETGIAGIDRLLEAKVGGDVGEPVFYATDRQPAGSGNGYTSDRGGALRLGTASVVPAADDLTWADARRIDVLKGRASGFPIRVESVREFGVMASSLSAFSKVGEAERAGAAAAEREFVRRIDDKLGRSNSRTIHLYIHGYKTPFENPILTASEMWHFLGNDGVFIAYSWPATPRTLAYISDTETAHTSARNLRLLIEFLAKRTRVETIHIVAYSAGTRVLSRTLADLALERRGPSLKLGTVVLMASDVDQGILGGYLGDGILGLVDQLTIYQSDSDKALSISRFLTNQERVGESLVAGSLTPREVAYFRANPKLCIVDVSDADSARKGNGHSYLRGSPWVSSDLLLSLARGESPDRRGLVRMGADHPVWTFPPDYPERLRAILLRLHPELSNHREP